MASCKQWCFFFNFLSVSSLIVLYYFITDQQDVLHYPQSYSRERCDDLYYIARKMLNGSQVHLPFHTTSTGDIHWKFHEGINPKLFNESLFIWNPERRMSSETKRSISFYNNTNSKDIRVKKHFITFASNCCKRSKLKAVMSAIYPGGFDSTKIYNMHSLTAGFKKRHNRILSKARGSGYWLWKPYVILKTLVETMSDYDILMYEDAGSYLIQDSGPLLKLCQHSKYGILLFYLTMLEKHFTKRDAFLLMKMDDKHIYNTFQRLASFMLFQKNCMSLQFVMEWLAYSSDPRLITDIENTMGKNNFPGFKEHRHDQSVLSLLSKKWGLTAYRTPSQYGNTQGYHAGPYAQIIMHTRNRS